MFEVIKSILEMFGNTIQGLAQTYSGRKFLAPMLFIAAVIFIKYYNIPIINEHITIFGGLFALFIICEGIADIISRTQTPTAG